MAYNLLAINVGNTNIRIGVFEAGVLSETLIIRVSDPKTQEVTIQQAWDRIKDKETPTIVLASVNPPAAQRLTENVSRLLGVPVYRIEHDMDVPIGRQLDPETIVGEDRLLAAAAAYDTLKQAVVIIDAGTAITIDYVDGAGTFHGGAIAPGARLQLRSLNQGTAQLPDLDPARPEEPIGHNTTQAMLSGVFYGIRGMVRELVEQYAEATGAFPMVVATGGDAKLLFEDFELVDRILPDLTLMGIYVTARFNADEESA